MGERPGTAEANKALFERDAPVYASLELQKPEQALLGRFRDRWASMSMLDIGVGSGRTAYTFAPLTRRYVGVDYAPRMVELSRERIGEDEGTTFAVCDARRLTEAFDERFDLILFSFNGIDSIDHEDRLMVLRQVRQLLADDGFFCFATHNLRCLPLEAPTPLLSPRSPARSAYRLVRALRQRRGVKRVNDSIDLPALRQRGWGQLYDAAHGFQALLYYVDPVTQVAQLEDAGFREVEVSDLSGGRVDASSPGTDPWLSYLCR